MTHPEATKNLIAEPHAAGTSTARPITSLKKAVYGGAAENRIAENEMMVTPQTGPSTGAIRTSSGPLDDFRLSADFR